MSWPFFYIKSPILRTIFMYDRERFSNFPPNQYHHRNEKFCATPEDSITIEMVSTFASHSGSAQRSSHFCQGSPTQSSARGRAYMSLVLVA